MMKIILTSFTKAVNFVSTSMDNLTLFNFSA